MYPCLLTCGLVITFWCAFVRRSNFGCFSFVDLTDLPRGRVKTLRQNGTWARVAVDPDDNLYLLGRQGKTLEIIYAHSHTCMAISRPCPVRYPSCASTRNHNRAPEQPPSSYQPSSLSSLGSPFFRSPRASHASPRSTINMAAGVSPSSASPFGSSSSTPPASSLMSRSTIISARRRTSLSQGSPNTITNGVGIGNSPSAAHSPHSGDDVKPVSVMPSSPSLHSTPRRSLNLHSRSIVLTHPSASFPHGQMDASLATPQFSTRSRRGSSASTHSLCTDRRRSSTASTLAEAEAAAADGDDSHPLPPPFPLHHNHPSHTHAQSMHMLHRGSLSASEPPTRSASPSFSSMSLSELDTSPALSSLSVCTTPATTSLSLREPPSAFSLTSPHGASDKKRSQSPSRHQNHISTPSSAAHAQHMGSARRRVSLSRNSQENIAMSIESVSRRSSLSRSSVTSVSQTVDKDSLAASTASPLLALSHNLAHHERKTSSEHVLDAASKVDGKVTFTSSETKARHRKTSSEQPLTLTRAYPSHNVTSDPTESPEMRSALSPARLPPRPPPPSAKPPPIPPAAMAGSPQPPVTIKRHSHGEPSLSEMHGVATPTSVSAPPSTHADRTRNGVSDQQMQQQQQQQQQHRCAGCDASLAKDDDFRFPRSRKQQIYGPDIYWLLGMCFWEGYLFLCDSSRHCVFRLDPLTGFMAVWAGAVDKVRYLSRSLFFFESQFSCDRGKLSAPH